MCVCLCVSLYVLIVCLSFLQVPLEDTYRKRLEYEFHSAGYHAIMEVVNGFRTAIGHLIREVSLYSFPISCTVRGRV